MRKKITLGAAITFCIITAAVVFSVTTVFSMQIYKNIVRNVSEREAIYKKLAEIDHIVRDKYIFDIDETTLLDKICEGYMSGLGNDYSYYMTEEEYNESNLSYGGQTIGIGIEQIRVDGYIKILEVYKGTPAEAAGLQANDLIIRVDDLDVTDSTYIEAVSILGSGEEESMVSITYRRDLEDTSIEITRARFETPTVKYRVIVNNDGTSTGLIKITRFNDNTYTQFSEAIEELTMAGVSGLIFDVRDNPGGTLKPTADMLDMLLPVGPIILATDSDENTEVLYQSGESEINLPMVIIANSETASAAELFTIALLDYDKAVLVGGQTHGKWTMQTIRKLNDGSAIRLTTHTYKSAKTLTVDGEGIIPSVEVISEPDEEQSRHQTAFAGLNEYNDRQLRVAMETLETIKTNQGYPLPEDASSDPGDLLTDPDGGAETGSEDSQPADVSN